MARPALPPPGITAPADAPVLYLWLLLPAGIAAVAATPQDAHRAARHAMDQHRDAEAAAVFTAHLTPGWPYIRVTPHGAWSRAAHDWMAASIAHAEAKQTRRKPRGAPRTPGHPA